MNSTIKKMGVDENGNKHVLINTTLAELERIVSELREGTKKWEDTSDTYSNIAITCGTGGETSSIIFWIDNPKNIKVAQF
jgi:hypothetical protein